MTLRLTGRGARRALLVVLASASWLAPARAVDLKTTRVASGLSRPLYATSPTGDSRLYIVEQRGAIKILEGGAVNSTNFINLNTLVSQSGSERGLLGLAFHPDFANNGKFYVNYTSITNGATVIDEYTASPGGYTASTTTRRQILSFSQPFSNHNGGWMGFGPDGYLYAGSGDGGSGGDPNQNGQNINTLLGKMLRIDVNGDDFADPNRNYAIPPDNPFVGVDGSDEIWHYGLRNPWRNSFDRETGDLYIADVGQNSREEVNFMPAGDEGGHNFGWSAYEGSLVYNEDRIIDGEEYIFPIHEYSHAQGCSVTGGYVYRGSDIPPLEGAYFLSDYCGSQIWSFEYDGETKTNFMNRTADLAPDVGTIGSVASFAEDSEGELYIFDIDDGEIFKIGANFLPGDANGDDIVDGADFTIWNDNFGLTGDNLGPADGDFNADGIVNGADFTIWNDNFGPPEGAAVPEPMSCVLGLVGAALAIAVGRQARGRAR